MSTEAQQSVAILGLGIMGSACLRPLRDHGFRLSLYNRNLSRARECARPGENVHASPADAAAGSVAVLSFVTDDAASRAVWDDAGGAFSTASAGTVVIEMSTVSVDRAEAWAAAAHERALIPALCPVTGSWPRATKGQLIGFTGGNPAERAAAEPFLSALTERQYEFDSHRQAAAYKLAHNLAACGALLGLTEALAVARANGIAADAALDVLSTYGWAAAVAESRGPNLADHNYGDILASVATMRKDVEYALAACGRDLGAGDLRVGAAIRDVLADACALGLGTDDMSSVNEVYIRA